MVRRIELLVNEVCGNVSGTKYSYAVLIFLERGWDVIAELG
jgi:hypothetical protein